MLNHPLTSKFFLLAIAGLACCSGCDRSNGSFTSRKSKAAPNAVAASGPADQITLPSDAGEAVWNVGQAPELQLRRPVDLTDQQKNGAQFWGAAIAPSANRAIATFMGAKERKSKKDRKSKSDARPTHAAYCDLASGQIIKTFPVKDFLAPLAIHPSGQHALLVRKDGVRSERESLYTVNLTAANPQPKLWRPLVDSNDKTTKLYVKEWEIDWAEYMGSRILTMNNAGKIHIWDLASKSRLGVITDVQGSPCLTPDRSKIAFLKDDNVCLFDPSTMKVVSRQVIGGVPPDAKLAFDPAGQRLAIAGKGQMKVLNVVTKELTESMISDLDPRNGMSLRSDLAWVGSLIYCNQRLYQQDSPIEVWRFAGSKWAMPIGRGLWAAVQNKGRPKKTYLRQFDFPIRKLEFSIANAQYLGAGLDLKPGDPVNIDVQGIPAEKRDSVQRNLEQRLAAHGYVAASRATVSLVASVDAKPTKCSLKYGESKFGFVSTSGKQYVINYLKQPAKLEFKKGNKSIWNTSKYLTPPNSLKEIPPDLFLKNYGGPDYKLFSDHRLPKYIRNRQANSTGSTRLYAEGMSEIK